MTSVPPIHHFNALTLVLIVAFAVIGCSKKTERPTVATPPGEPVAAAPAATTPPPTRPAASIPASTDIRQSFAEADAALKAKAYEKAVQAMLAVQHQKQLTEQQAQEARNRMVGLQQNLAAAIASGDPNAKAAAELLRSSAMVR